MTETKAIGPFLKQVRYVRGLHLDDLAGKVSRSSLSRMESGKIDLTSSRLDEIIQALGVTFDDFGYRGMIGLSLYNEWPKVEASDWEPEAAQRVLKYYESLKEKDFANPFLDMVITAMSELLWVKETGAKQFRRPAIQAMNKYFKRITEMTQIEETIIEKILYLVPSRTSVKWVRTQFDFTMANADQVQPKQKDCLLTMVCSTGEQALIEKKYDIVDEMLADAQTLASMLTENPTVQYNLRALAALKDVVVNPSPETRYQFAQIIETTLLLFPIETYNYMRK
ncbi:helix-turn-helix domain-containing protein [Lacticaseibacillus hulanensis]|uniref:helix-turn-helix domain-containing protein n=1 Tax=Lacticaseibacillus hulanensis TaxID=2493111 RepID=UPI000FD75E37|nr:helix-turn-helix transcriptional regulator [Lacticaseibacillus hulanensis]